METQSQNLRTIADHSQYTQKVCQPQCEIFKNHPRYSELIYTVASLGELDQMVRDTVVKYLDRREDICQIVVSPRRSTNDPSGVSVAGNASQQWNYDWVLVLTRENLVLFDSAHPYDRPMVRKAPIENLLSIEWASILLQSWVDWSWVDGQKVEHARINFNTSGAKPIEETLGFIHKAGISDFRISHQRLSEQSPIINSIPYKFVDHLPLLLTPQEKILAAVNYPFQPAVWKSWHGLFRKQERKATPSIALILTESHFVMIYEDAHDLGLRLGTIIQTIKRKNIIKLLIENILDGPQLILLVGDKNAEERIIIPAPEECFEELIERFRLYFR